MPDTFSSDPVSVGDTVATPRITRLELPICRLANSVRSRPLLGLFTMVNWLGHGSFWAALGFGLVAVDGRTALPAFYHMVLATVACFTIHKILKKRLARPRPFVTDPGFHLIVDPLDEFSFPSGHTLHAVAFTMVLAVHYPLVAWCTLPFTVLVAMSRVVLGLHYPSDVLAGAAMGILVTLAVIQVG